MKQNKYDDPEFFARYSAMPRSVDGLQAAGEWHTLREMLPDLNGMRVLDLGCGFGWQCRHARGQGASRVIGIDLSVRMLERARELTDDPAIDFRLMAIEDVDFPANSFDVVLSSLAFHYLERLHPVFRAVHRCLSPGGRFVFSMEHPVFTSRSAQDWHHDADGKRMHWPVDEYQREGIRHSTWMSDDIVKYHRTMATIVNAVIEAGFRLEEMAESGAPPDTVGGLDDRNDENRRPMFLLLAAVRV